MTDTRIETAPAALDEERDLFEMVNLHPRTTGLPMTIWARPRGHARHDARIEACMTPGERMDADNTAVVGVRPRAALLQGELPADSLALVLHWVELNADALIDYWNSAVDTVEFVARLRRV